MSSSESEDLSNDPAPPSSINPYEVLGLEKSATEAEVKSAYKKAALKHHPDKAPAHLASTAHTKFQEIAFAYAILSSPHRRSRYDATGLTDESLADDSDFDWTSFYRAQFADVISSDAIENFARGYKKSDEERNDLLAMYEKHRGNMDQVYQEVMVSDPVEDDERFRAIIDAAIKAGEVEGYKAYTKESKRSREGRLKRARGEEEESKEMAKELGYDKLFKESKGIAAGGEDALKALIQQRSKSSAQGFLERLEAKYAGDKSSTTATKQKKGQINGKAPSAKVEKTKAKPVRGKKGKKRAPPFDDDDVEDVSKRELEDDGPPESAFQAMAERATKNRSAATSKTDVGAMVEPEAPEKRGKKRTKTFA